MTARTELLSALLLLSVSSSVWAQIEPGNVPPEAPQEQPVTVEIVRLKPEATDSLYLELLLKMGPKVHIYAAESLFFKIDESSAKGLGKSTVTLPAPAKYKNFDGSLVDVFKDGAVIRISKPIRDSIWFVEGSFHYQACNERMCFMPSKHAFRFSSTGKKGEAGQGLVEQVTAPGQGAQWGELVEGFKMVGSAAGYLNAEAFLAFLQEPSEYGRGILAGRSIWMIILLVLLGGFALNFTPCVLPMIPITVAVIGAGARAGTRTHGFLLGVAYGLGMSVAYGTAGLVVVLTGTRFGVLNSSPLFNLAIAAIFVALSLAMFDILHIDFTRYRSSVGRESQGKGYAAVLGMGVIAALLAGACVAPVLISVVLYSTNLYAEGQRVGLLLPFLLGAGMALPWPFAGAGLSFLPKPGKWMTWVRNSFGVIILVIALYYGWTGIKLFRTTVAFDETNDASSALPWIHSLEQGLAAAREGHKPVLIDFWATWCKNCLAMDATTFRDPQVAEKLSSFVLVKYKAENPREASTKSVLDHFRVLGLPTYVILEPDR